MHLHPRLRGSRTSRGRSPRRPPAASQRVSTGSLCEGHLPPSQTPFGGPGPGLFCPLPPPSLCHLAFPGGDSEGKEDPQDAQPARIWGRLWWELKSQAQQLIAERWRLPWPVTGFSNQHIPGKRVAGRGASSSDVLCILQPAWAPEILRLLTYHSPQPGTVSKPGGGGAVALLPSPTMRLLTLLSMGLQTRSWGTHWAPGHGPPHRAQLCSSVQVHDGVGGSSSWTLRLSTSILSSKGPLNCQPQGALVDAVLVAVLGPEAGRRCAYTPLCFSAHHFREGGWGDSFAGWGAFLFLVCSIVCHTRWMDTASGVALLFRHSHDVKAEVIWPRRGPSLGTPASMSLFSRPNGHPVGQASCYSHLPLSAASHRAVSPRGPHKPSSASC